MKRQVQVVLLAILSCCIFSPESHEAQKSTPVSKAKPVDDAALKSVDARAGEWLTHGRNYAETRFSPLNQINSRNVSTDAVPPAASVTTRERISGFVASASGRE